MSTLDENLLCMSYKVSNPSNKDNLGKEIVHDAVLYKKMPIMSIQPPNIQQH